ncbi:RhoGAP domain containing protein [Entamoeba histolytica HM-1:IMSS-B]|uniref:RhoGAP domain containing protein n=4 Tax=Entamoeba histolytica TaxID=5759 RepID=C4LXB0_ENTH1|nr:RhoGAP domain containing protein [Entamoeba histolytica HM-1:IMSS]EAL48236.1 RhoGAP domain containing protein [Entamoeba histolytica HM-1:IMSS]EMH78113.1 RhoGAP domain containing protein [Entamoeba histolytica HM-1:IMSS-B]ENY62639.1 RhoGAP domain containing protein [Entamoeba histolytica HM-1:IMSS-A]GAT93383.1 rhogap domain containing protein [Entamoeba histolytica]|eukprot:XP_653622.1 RhoGAP domain containing protein [Entamoeba histolytica HM-1:IMSS]
MTCFNINQPIFSVDLETIMSYQKSSHPNVSIPIAFLLMKDTIIALGGNKLEGLFRVPGKQDDIDGYKTLFNEGKYEIYKECNCHTIASLFKLFLRELPTPIIPPIYYDKFVNEDVVAKLDESPEKVMELLNLLPRINRDMFIFIIDFLQFLVPFESLTKMDMDNLAMVFSACMIINPDLDPFSALTKTNLAKNLIYEMILHMPKSAIQELDLNVQGYTSGKGMLLLETDPIESLKEETESKKTKDKSKKQSGLFRSRAQTNSKNSKHHTKHGSEAISVLSKSTTSTSGDKSVSPRSTSPSTPFLLTPYKKATSIESSNSEQTTQNNSSTPVAGSPSNVINSPRQTSSTLVLYDIFKAPAALLRPTFIKPN